MEQITIKNKNMEEFKNLKKGDVIEVCSDFCFHDDPILEYQEHTESETITKVNKRYYYTEFHKFDRLLCHEYKGELVTFMHRL